MCINLVITLCICTICLFGIIYVGIICDDNRNLKLKHYRIVSESNSDGMLYIPQWSYFGKIWHNFDRYVCMLYDVSTERCSFDTEDECMKFLKKEYTKNRNVVLHRKKTINFDNIYFDKTPEKDSSEETDNY